MYIYRCAEYFKKSKQDVIDFEVLVEAEREEEHPRVFKEVSIHYIIKGHKINKSHVERAIELTEKYWWSFNYFRPIWN